MKKINDEKQNVRVKTSSIDDVIERNIYKIPLDLQAKSPKF